MWRDMHDARPLSMRFMNDRTIGGLLQLRAEATPDKPFLWCSNSWKTYGELAAASDRFAAGLQGLGVAPGDRVAMVLPTEHAAAISIFGAARLGAIQVPLNTFLRGEFLRYQLANSRSSIAVTDILGYEQIRHVLSELRDLRIIILVGDLASADRAGLGDVAVVPFDALLTSEPVARFPAVSPENTYSILYTSGTTGMPKGCLISHRYATGIARGFSDTGRFGPGDRILTPSPLFHASGSIVGMVSALYRAGSIAFMQEFQASTFVALAGELKATVLFGAAAVGAFILAQPERASDRQHCIRQAFFNAMPESTQLALEARFGFHVVGESFGHTECVPITASPVDGPRRRGSGGSPLPHMEVQIVDDSDLQVPVDTVGEIVARPREPGYMFDGYWDNPQATVDLRSNLWHHTGDLGRFDADGFLWYVDRKKEAIRRRGEFVTARELETAILKHPDIAAVAVHAVASDVIEDEIKAWLVLKPGIAITPDNLFAFFREALPYFAIPRFVELIDELPRNHYSRVMKHVLKGRTNGVGAWDFESLGLVVRRGERRATK